MKHRHRILPAAALTVAAAACAASAQIEVLYTSIPTDPSSVVPGALGERFTAFARPARSPDGSRWVLGATTTSGSVLLTGAGPTATVALREGDVAPWDAAFTVGTLATATSGTAEDPFLNKMVILDDGRYAFPHRAVGTLGEFIIHWDGAAFQVVAQQGAPAGPLAPALYGFELDCPQLAADGRTGLRARSMTSIITTQNDALLFGGAVLAQKGLTVPGNLLVGTDRPWTVFDRDMYYVSADGLSWCARGWVGAGIGGDGTNNQVAVVNGDVVAQEGAILPGSFFVSPVGNTDSTIEGIISLRMMPGGDWYARGTNMDGDGWVVRNGQVLATTGDEAAPLTTSDLWDKQGNGFTFFAALGNDVGDWIIGGTTDNLLPAQSRIYSLNGASEIVRSHDFVDVDGDGTFNESVVITALSDDAFLTGDGLLYFIATLGEVNGPGLGEALLRVRVAGTPCPCDFDGAPGVDVFDLLAYLNLWFPADPAADIDGAPGVDVFDLLFFLDCWFPASAGTPCP